MLCGPCQDEAPQLQALYQQHQAEGFIVITLLGENVYGQPPSQSDLQMWASSFGLQHPVLADPGWAAGDRFERDGYIPTISLLQPGAKVLLTDSGYATSQVPMALP